MAEGLGTRKVEESENGLIDELEVLGAQLDNLALSETAGFKTQARESFAYQGIEPIAVDLIARSREFACQALQRWVNVVSDQPDEARSI